MKSLNLKYLAIIIACCCLLACEQTPQGHAGKETRSFSSLSGHADSIRSGDIIVKRGRGMLSNRIIKTLNEPVPLSHCGIMLRRNDSLLVIHSVSKELTGRDGVQLIPYSDFMQDCVAGYTYIVRYRKNDCNKRITDSALHYLKKRVPFDYEINYSDAGKMNCTEFVYWSLLRGTDRDVFQLLTIDKQQILSFNSLIDSSNFCYIHRL